MTLRFAAMKELAQYIAPKRKAVEVSGPECSPVPLAAPIITPEEFEAIARRIDCILPDRIRSGLFLNAHHHRSLRQQHEVV
jgi:hypothetical protein